MRNPTAAMLVIGDEILSGRTRDSNMYHLANKLTEQGIDLIEVRIVSDDAPAIIAAVQELSVRCDHVFTSGGIGPTHDDITADCMAKAFNDHIDVRADAAALLQELYDSMGKDFNDARKRMARIPDTATLIENPVSIAPGFTIKNVHVMAGVPSVFQAMVESVLPQLKGGQPVVSQTTQLDMGEGDIAAPLTALAEQFSDLSVGCYPFQKDGVHGANIVIRGTDRDRVNLATTALRDVFGCE